MSGTLLRSLAGVGASVVLALWPAVGLAVGGDTRGSAPTNATSQVDLSVTEHRWVEAAHGGDGGGMDPDSWDSATVSRTYHVSLSVRGGSSDADTDAVGCIPSPPASAETSLKMPAMSAGSLPSPEKYTGLGGIVNDDTVFWVEGYNGVPASSPVASVTLIDCGREGIPPRTTSTTRTFTSSISYESHGSPAWSFGDGGAGSGYSGVRHRYLVSSGNCVIDGIFCVDVPAEEGNPARGPVYVVRFSIPFQVTYHSSTNGDDSDSIFERRNRAFPVREVQSIVTRSSQPNP